MTNQLEKRAADTNKRFMERYSISLVIKCTLKKYKLKYNMFVIVCVYQAGKKKNKFDNAFAVTSGR